MSCSITYLVSFALPESLNDNIDGDNNCVSNYIPHIPLSTLNLADGKHQKIILYSIREQSCIFTCASLSKLSATLTFITSECFNR